MVSSLLIKRVSKKQGQNGFTLLEVLVVLVIVSLISTLLLQGFGYTLNLRSRILTELGRVQNEELAESWFRKTTASIILKEKNLREPLSFLGSTKHLSGDTLFSLDNPAGVSTTIKWTIETDNEGYTRLFYIRSKQQTKFNSQKWEVAKWFDSNVSFSYLARDGEWRSNWPVEEYSDELPTGIMLTVEKESRPFFWYSRIIGEKQAPIKFEL